jgi:hypothetical protein
MLWAATVLLPKYTLLLAVIHESDTSYSAVAAALLPGHVPAIHRLQDIVETPAAFELHCDAPGFSPDDVSVEMNEGVITISGKRKEEKQEEHEGKVSTQAAAASEGQEHECCCCCCCCWHCLTPGRCFQNILATVQ